MSNSQNIYDDPAFFKGYHDLRERDDNHNVLVEQPAMAKLLPDLQGKTVLDLGCGCGWNCKDFISRGAAHVVGIDISENMLNVARVESADPHIEYHRMDMTEISALTEQVDMVYSSLAFHYIENFPQLLADITRLLVPGGMLLFSQEHPLNTATIDEKISCFHRDEHGTPIAYTFSDYNRPGKRTVTWFVEGVEKYHRPMGVIITDIARAGLIIEEVCEPTASDWALVKRPALIKEEIKPCFLIIRARKPF